MTAKKTSRKTAAPVPGPSRFFASADALRRWLERHHGRASELWIGFHRKDSGARGIGYSEALDVALCFGWIDGIRKKLRRDQLREPVHAAEARQHLEPDQYRVASNG